MGGQTRRWRPATRWTGQDERSRRRPGYCPKGHSEANEEGTPVQTGLTELFRPMMERARAAMEERKSKLTSEQLALCEEARKLERNIEIKRYKEGEDEIIVEAQGNYMIIERRIPGSPFKSETVRQVAPTP